MTYYFRVDGSGLKYAHGARGAWDAIARSLARRNDAPTTCWPICEHSSRAQWYDRKAEVYREALVRTRYCADSCICKGADHIEYGVAS